MVAVQVGAGEDEVQGGVGVEDQPLPGGADVVGEAVAAVVEEQDGEALVDEEVGERGGLKSVSTALVSLS